MKKIQHKIGLGTVNISPKAKRYIKNVLDSKRLSYGKYSQKFEQLFAKLHQCKYASLCNSGTSALQAAIKALKIYYHWDKNSEIIAPALTFVASINTILYNQLRVKLVDVEADTFNLDSNKIEQAITPNTKAILAAHLFGQPANMAAIKKIAKRHKLKIIEDSCETMFAVHHQKPVGSFGNVACFSTYAAHLIATGVGGIITCQNENLNKIIKSLINHGRDSDYLNIDNDDQLSKKSLKRMIETRFSFKYFGYSYRLSELEAALGLDQLENYQKIINPRQKNAAYLSKKLKSLEKFLQLPVIAPYNSHVFMVYPLVLKKKSVKLADLLFFLEKNNIETRYLLPLIKQPIYKSLNFKSENFPVASYLQENGFYIGCHQNLKKSDLDYIVKKFNQFFGNNHA